MDLVLDYEEGMLEEETQIGAEVELSTDDGDVIPPAKKKKKPSKLLKKDERDALIVMLGKLAADTTTISTAVIDVVSKETHLRLYKDRGIFWSLLSTDSNMMSTLVQSLQSLFIHLYKKCQVGKDKYCRLQLEWLRECSVLLQSEGTSKGSSREVNQLHPKWLKYCCDNQVDIAVSNPVIISLCSAFFDYLMLKIAKHQKAGCDDHDKPVMSDEEMGVYYRFGGAALCSMLQLRYDQIKGKDVPPAKRERIHTEISVLKAIQATDKQHLPKYLEYRDKGHMYFPAEQFIPFIEHVDTYVREHANALSLQKHGKNLVAVTTKNLQENSALEAEFNSLLEKVYT